MANDATPLAEGYILTVLLAAESAGSALEAMLELANYSADPRISEWVYEPSSTKSSPDNKSWMQGVIAHCPLSRNNLRYRKIRITKYVVFQRDLTMIIKVYIFVVNPNVGVTRSRSCYHGPNVIINCL